MGRSTFMTFKVAAHALKELLPMTLYGPRKPPKLKAPTRVNPPTWVHVTKGKAFIVKVCYKDTR